MNDFKFNGHRFNANVDSLVYVTNDYSHFACCNNISRQYRKTLNSLRKYGNPHKRVVKVHLKDNLLVVSEETTDLFLGLVAIGLPIYFTIISDVSIKLDINEKPLENRFYE